METKFLMELVRLGITPNEFYLLMCVFNDETPNLINKHLETRNLQSKGFLNKDFKLTEKLEESGLAKYLIKTDKKDFIQSYIDLFPKIKLPSGKYARAHRTNIESAFKWFFKNYNYSWEVILKVTEFYVSEYETKDYLYMRTSQFFISKTNPDRSKESELANYCEMYLDGTLNKESHHFSEKVV